MTTTNCSEGPSAYKSSGRWLEPEEYLELAVSGRRMARCDEPDRGVRGLLDLATGERFFVSEERVLSIDLFGCRPPGTVSP
jgi:hypothetical protein